MFRRRWIRRLLQQIAPARREEVSAQYWRELQQLLAQGEISLQVARRIEQDMFEPEVPGEPRIINGAAWELHLDGRQRNLDLAMSRATEDGRAES